ncbi:MAG: hypothetical protein M1834_001155 [Cirrosporium novae-zelandiae]|nr:MAG: hypothetical protein M1834_001155 [Cirrosporium novae-zelandiae]
MAAWELADSPSNKVSLKQLEGESFDYIIVGGGTSGCLIAARIAAAIPGRQILLVEAGGDVEEDPDNLIPGLTVPKFGSEAGNWLYLTTPQATLNGRIITYPRGRGIGGCSTNNFMGWVRGPKTDFDDWAEIVGDSWWKWDNVLEVLKDLEDFRPDCPSGMEKYARPAKSTHGKGGPFAVGYNKIWQPLIPYCLTAAQESGHDINPDHNNGNPLGISVAQFNTDNGVRVTSATAFLSDNTRRRLKNLTIVTNTICSRLIFNRKRINGVHLLPTKPEGLDNPIYVHSRCEVILSAGCFQSAHLLLLSGIGPSEDLAPLGIPPILNQPYVGKNLLDHSAFSCEFIIDRSIAGHNQLLNSPSALKSATKEYKSSQTGPLAMFGASASIIFTKLPALFASAEFSSLPPKTQNFLTVPTRPNTEVWMHSGPLFYQGPCPPDASILVLEGLNQNNLSRGTLKLASSNPRDLPTIDPKYLSHPLDKLTALETLKQMLKLSKTPAFKSIIRSVLHGPRSPSNPSNLASPATDIPILESFIRENLTQGFHSMGACAMGSASNPERVVDASFKVLGLDGLRVADMSVCPILTTNHTQVNAYLIGERCAGLVVEEARRRALGEGGSGEMSRL